MLGGRNPPAERESDANFFILAQPFCICRAHPVGFTAHRLHEQADYVVGIVCHTFKRCILVS